MNEILKNVEQMIKASPQDRMLAKGILDNLKLENKQDNQIKINLRIVIDILSRPRLPQVYPNAWVKQWFKMNIIQFQPWTYKFKNHTNNETFYPNNPTWDNFDLWSDNLMS